MANLDRFNDNAFRFFNQPYMFGKGLSIEVEDDVAYIMLRVKPDVRDTVKWIADACDGDAKDLTRIIPIGEAIEDYELFYGTNEKN
ncbi:hypothetical protein [Paenibacillus ginsengarvi]|uniref:Uncharacterized protein n=1 Tax=Paenibacillus ginsengarvi TaxID=400777 RepID=A0A3B0CN12_9BACL|nr:hypothetical protein [Paenibacillus ginsengarvi]RKN86783.1 hypothetical protein D7M11_02155 [Paenibacillus ginsengarvi]